MKGLASTEKGQGRREQVLRAALTVVANGGVQAASHRAIAREAGVPLATTTYYFSSLDDLLEQALRLYVQEEVADLEAATERLAALGEPTIEELADAFAEVIVASHADGGAVAQFELYLEASRRPGLRAVAAECLAAYHRLATAALESVGSPYAGTLAPLFVALADGQGLHRLTIDETDKSAEQLARSFVALYSATHPR